MNKGELSRLISYVDSIYCQFGGADRKVYGDEHLEELHALKRKAAAADLAFIPARIRHLGTDVNSEILSHMRDSLPNNVTVIAKTPVDTILADKDGSVLGVVAGGETYHCKYLVSARAVTVLNGLPARRRDWASRRSRMLSTSVSA